MYQVHMFILQNYFWWVILYKIKDGKNIYKIQGKDDEIITDVFISNFWLSTLIRIGNMV